MDHWLRSFAENQRQLGLIVPSWIIGHLNHRMVAHHRTVLCYRPVGYVEADESSVEAVIREVYEEVGPQVEVTGLVHVYFFTDYPRGNGILVVYNYIIVDGVLTESNEATAPGYFVSQDIPIHLAGGGHDQAIRTCQELHIAERRLPTDSI